MKQIIFQNRVDHVLWLCFSAFQSDALIVILQSLPDAFRLRRDSDQSLRQHETSKLSPFSSWLAEWSLEAINFHPLPRLCCEDLEKKMTQLTHLFLS